MLVPAEGDMVRRPQVDFRALFRAHYRYVRITLRRLGVRDAEVEDVAQDVFVVVHRKLAFFDDERSIKLWLFGICMRTASAHRRLARHRRQVHPEEPLDMVHEGPLPDDQLEAEESRRLVLAALDAVHPQRRPVFVMYDLNEFSVAEISEMLSIPVNTVYSKLRVAREEFRQGVMRLRTRGRR